MSRPREELPGPRPPWRIEASARLLAPAGNRCRGETSEGVVIEAVSLWTPREKPSATARGRPISHAGPTTTRFGSSGSDPRSAHGSAVGGGLHLEVEVVMQGASWIEGSAAGGAPGRAAQIARDRQPGAARAAQNGGPLEVCARPPLRRVVGQGVVTFTTGEPTSAAGEADRHDVGRAVPVLAPALGVHPRSPEARTPIPFRPPRVRRRPGPPHPPPGRRSSRDLRDGSPARPPPAARPASVPSRAPA